MGTPSASLKMTAQAVMQPVAPSGFCAFIQLREALGKLVATTHPTMRSRAIAGACPAGTGPL